MLSLLFSTSLGRKGERQGEMERVREEFVRRRRKTERRNERSETSEMGEREGDGLREWGIGLQFQKKKDVG